LLLVGIFLGTFERLVVRLLKMQSEQTRPSLGVLQDILAIHSNIFC